MRGADAAWGIGGAAAAAGAGSQWAGDTGYAELGDSGEACVSAFAGSALGLVMEIATSLGSDVRALLFWEQARWLSPLYLPYINPICPSPNPTISPLYPLALLGAD